MCGCVCAGVCVRTFVSSHPRILLPFASPLTYAGGRKRNEQYEQGEFKKKKKQVRITTVKEWHGPSLTQGICGTTFTVTGLQRFLHPLIFCEESVMWQLTVFTLCFYWRNSEARHRGQQNRTENSEQNPLVCDQLIFNKGPETIRGGKELSFQETVLVSVDLHVQKNETGPLPCSTYKYYLKMDNNPIVRGLVRAKPIEHLGWKKVGIYVFLP